MVRNHADVVCHHTPSLCRFVCCVYCLDAQFLSEPTKLLAGALQAMSAMVLLETPHVNVMTKADLVQDQV